MSWERLFQAACLLSRFPQRGVPARTPFPLGVCPYEIALFWFALVVWLAVSSIGILVNFVLPDGPVSRGTRVHSFGGTWSLFAFRTFLIDGQIWWYESNLIDNRANNLEQTMCYSRPVIP
jgi:hypothetical protein